MTDKEQIREQLLDIIATEGMVDRAKLTPDATIESIGMASYDMVMILMAIEEKFGVYLSVESELTEVKTLDQLLDGLADRIQTQQAAAAEAANAPAGANGATEECAAAPNPGSSAAAAAAAAVTMATPAATPTVTPAEPKSETEPS
jgi:acyl carrier protein